MIKNLKRSEAWVPCSVAAMEPKVNYIIGIEDLGPEISFFTAHHTNVFWAGDQAYTAVQVLRADTGSCYVLVMSELIEGRQILQMHLTEVFTLDAVVSMSDNHKAVADELDSIPEDPAEEPTWVAR